MSSARGKETIEVPYSSDALLDALTTIYPSQEDWTTCLLFAIAYAGFYRGRRHIVKDEEFTIDINRKRLKVTAGTADLASSLKNSLGKYAKA